MIIWKTLPFELQSSSPVTNSSSRQLSTWFGLAGFFLLLPTVAAQQLQWMPQGAAPDLHGQVENIEEGEVSGGIQALALHPKDPNIVYVGSVNGGLWKSVNAMDVSPRWQQLTDDQDSLSIGAAEIDPTDSTSQTIVVGMGRFSSLAQAGGARSGLLRSTDGGKSWLQIGSQIKGLNISGVAPRGQTILISANDADDVNNVGIWRATGGSWLKMSGRAGTGLPAGACASLASDPTTLGRFFANAGAAGLFKTENTGATWTKVSNRTMDNLIATADNIKISAGPNGSVYVAIDVGGHLAGVFYSMSSGAGWNSMDLPAVEEGGIHPGGQGDIHLAITVDPKRSNIVYIGGDRQPAKFMNGQETGVNQSDPPQWPNSIGAYDYTGRLFRGDSAKPHGAQWVHITHSNTLGPVGGGTAHSSAPHADSRGLQVAPNGMLIGINDGGIYRETNPESNDGDWLSMNGNLQVAEFHSVAWDSSTHTIFAGAQDTGTPEQQAVSMTQWMSLSTGDGGVVAVDDISTSNRSVRYSSAYNLISFRRDVYDSSNQLQSSAYPALIVLNGGAPLSPQFYTPIKLNAVNPMRMIIGAQNSVYESLDQGDTATEIGKNIVLNSNGAGPIAYGATNNQDILYVGAGPQVFVRQGADPAPLVVSSSYKGGTVLGIALDPNHAESAFVISPTKVSSTVDFGQSWKDITGALATGPSGLRSITYCNAEAAGALIVGTDNGVYIASGPSFSSWAPLGVGLPNAPIYHVEYSSSDRVLLAGSLGRGAWTLQFPNASSATTRANLVLANSQVSMAIPARAQAVPSPPVTPPAQGGAQEPSGKVQLAPGVIVDTARGEIFATDLTGGIKAIDLKTGGELWTTKEVAKPLGFSGTNLLGQVEGVAGSNAFKVATIDPTNGREIGSAVGSLPAQVIPLTSATLKGNFSAVASSLPGGDAVIRWQYARKTARALPPGTKPTLSPSRGSPPPQSNGQESVTQGAFKLNAATSLMQAIPLDSTIAALSPLTSDLPISGDSNRRILSVDGKNYLTSSRTDATDEEKYSLTVYDTRSGNLLGSFKSSVAAFPFVVSASTIIYESGPSVQKTAAGLITRPTRITAVDLTTAKELWTSAIRDAVYRGPVPP